MLRISALLILSFATLTHANDAVAQAMSVVYPFSTLSEAQREHLSLAITTKCPQVQVDAPMVDLLNATRICSEESREHCALQIKGLVHRYSGLGAINNVPRITDDELTAVYDGADSKNLGNVMKHVIFRLVGCDIVFNAEEKAIIDTIAKEDVVKNVLPVWMAAAKSVDELNKNLASAVESLVKNLP